MEIDANKTKVEKMTKENLLWRETFKIRAYEVGPDGRLKLTGLFNFLQEAASNHAVRLKLAKPDLDALGLTWVLSRFHLQIVQMPFWNEQIVVETWPSHKDHLFALRDFEVFNEQKQVIARATSSWMMIDFKERRAVRLPDFLKDMINPERGRAIEDRFERLPELNEPQSELQFRVRFSDLDVNQHVNSSVYIDWALEAVADDLRKQYQLQSLQINYRAEVQYGKNVIAQTEVAAKSDPVVVLHRLMDAENRKELCRMVSLWR